MESWGESKWALSRVTKGIYELSSVAKLGFHPTRVVQLLLTAFHWMDPFADDDRISILGNLLGLKFE